MSTRVDAIPDSVVDDFERGNLDPYIIFDGDFSIVSSGSMVLEGDNSLLMDSDDTTQALFSYPGDGLDNYPKRGQDVRTFVRWETAGEFGIAISGGGSSDKEPMFNVSCDPTSELRVYTRDDGFSELVSTSISEETGSYNLGFRWHDNNEVEGYLMEFGTHDENPQELASVGPVSLPSSLEDARGVGFEGTSSDNAGGYSADYIRIMGDVGWDD